MDALGGLSRIPGLYWTIGSFFLPVPFFIGIAFPFAPSFWRPLVHPVRDLLVHSSLCSQQGPLKHQPIRCTVSPKPAT